MVYEWSNNTMVSYILFLYCIQRACLLTENRFDNVDIVHGCEILSQILQKTLQKLVFFLI